MDLEESRESVEDAKPGFFALPVDGLSELLFGRLETPKSVRATITPASRPLLRFIELSPSGFIAISAIPRKNPPRPKETFGYCPAAKELFRTYSRRNVRLQVSAIRYLNQRAPIDLCLTIRSNLLDTIE